MSPSTQTRPLPNPQESHEKSYEKCLLYGLAYCARGRFYGVQAQMDAVLYLLGIQYWQHTALEESPYY